MRSAGSADPADPADPQPVTLPWEIEAPARGGGGAGGGAGDGGGVWGPGGSVLAPLLADVPDPARTVADVPAPDLAPTPSAAGSRLRIGVGAAVVLVLVALVCAVLVSMFAGHGRAEVIALPSGGASGVTGGTRAPESAGGAPALGSAGEAPSPGATGGTRSPGAAGGAPPPAAGPAASGAAARASAPLILVHVLGAVVHPGLYELHTGDRVIDAVSAAGGFSEKADQGQQNLARAMTDGEQLVIPEQGASPPLGSAGSAGSAGASSGGAGPAAGTQGGPPPALVNLNTADQATLETLPHVGPAMAQRIIAWRTENGRFTQVDDLKNVSGVGDKTFEALAPLVTI